MMRLSAHIGYLYAELPLLDRLAAAAADGFTAVEHPSPFAVDSATMRQRLRDLGLSFSQITSGMGEGDEKGLAALPHRRAAFRDGFRRALDYALEVDCPFVHPMAGLVKDATPQDAAMCYADNIRWCLDQMAPDPQRLLIEPITLPGYHMGQFDQALDIRASDTGRIAILFDSYHAAKRGLNPAAWIAAHGDSIGHVHLADYPNRAEPESDSLDFWAILNSLKARSYQGALGFEYIPSRPDSTGFLRRWQDMHWI